jgi:cytochrome c-type biogenesis protein CcmH
MKILQVLALLCLLPFPAFALYEEEALSDPSLEARAAALEGEIRCRVCEGQSIRDSDSELAAGMRRLIRRELESGRSEAEIRALLEQRYGRDILLKPGLSAATVLLWGAPLIFLAIAGIVFAARKKDGAA